jgi:DNA-binding PadR family transcriptional regulator
MVRTIRTAHRSLSDWAVLALLAEGPAHGFQLAKEFSEDGVLGEVWSIQRPQVYRALEHLEEAGQVTALREEESRSGPPRTVYSVTRDGERAVDAWLYEPVARLRDVRHELLLKLVLLVRRERDLAPLLAAQRTLADEMIERCERGRRDAGDEERVVMAWRMESARALLRLLDALEGAPDRAARRADKHPFAQ